MQSYTFSIYTFTSKEIDQICTLVDGWSGGQLAPIKRTSYTRQVLAYAVAWGLLEENAQTRLVYTAGSWHFDPLHNLPIEALWRIVEPMLNGQQSIGRSIAKHPAWTILNVYPAGHRRSTEITLREQEDILVRLQQYGYVIAQFAGNVWNIERGARAA